MVNPFHFPTAIAVIDDNANFLRSLVLAMDPDLYWIAYDKPALALKKINENNETGKNSLWANIFAANEEFRGEDSDRLVVDVRIGDIKQIANNPMRYNHTSVVVVDYCMPEMNGVEFCRNIKNKDIFKILLTGQADEKIAINAFNDGVIDVFIRKQQDDALVELCASIKMLQYKYLHRKSVTLQGAIATSGHRYLSDPAFVALFEGLCAKYSIVEYYLHSVPNGMVMMDKEGNISLLIVYAMEALRSEIEIAESQGAPSQFINCLKSLKVVPYFQPEMHYSPDCVDWAKCLHPASALIGEARYLYAVINNPIGFEHNNYTCYSNFLDFAYGS